jgi:hypothetical protein
MACTVLTTAPFTLPPATRRFCPDALLSFSALILPASSDTRCPRRSLAAACLQGLGRLLGSQGFELRSIVGGAAPFVSTSSMPP